MAGLITIKVVKNEWGNLIKVLGSRRVGKALGDAGNKVSKIVKTNLQNELMRQDLIWKGRLLKSIQVRRRGNINQVTALGYGIMLDRMRPHWVSLKRGRNITKWARDKIGKPIPRAIFVRPHPWINRPVAQGLRNTNRIVTHEINKLLRQAKTGV